IISLRRGIKPRNPQNIIKNYETCGSNVHTTSEHNDIEWFRKREALQAKKVESFKATQRFQIKQSKRGISINKERYVKDLLRKYDKIGSSVNTPIMPPNMSGPDLNGKAINESWYKAMVSAKAEDVAAAGCCANILWITSQLTDYDIIYEKLKNHILKGDSEFHSFPLNINSLISSSSLWISHLSKRLIDELGMLKIDSKPKASVLTKEN
ncbi:hypothetical protein Tco_0959211, partial [Tanacetum coccineum]